MSELKNLKCVALPTRAKELYVGRGFTLPSWVYIPKNIAASVLHYSSSNRVNITQYQHAEWSHNIFVFSLPTLQSCSLVIISSYTGTWIFHVVHCIAERMVWTRWKPKRRAY